MHVRNCNSQPSGHTQTITPYNVCRHQDASRVQNRTKLHFAKDHVWIHVNDVAQEIRSQFETQKNKYKQHR